MKRKNKFRKGDLVKSISGNMKILVTGAGDKNAGYPCFSGVVVTKEHYRDVEDSLVSYERYGSYSDTWGTDAFKKIDKSLSVL